MDAELIARWQFGITTVYHFLFVPITIGVSMLVAVMQTMWYRSGNDNYLRLTKFFGRLFLINFALGVVTGIVQEFQFGMNWSEYSRFVGDVFGAPLALEALMAFFLESTFLGLWIFGWDRLPKGLHLATIYLASIGTILSSTFILAANSWMQNPVGATFRNGRAELTDFPALFTNPVFAPTFTHTISASYMVAGGFVAGISALHLAKLHRDNKNGTVVRHDKTLSSDEVTAELKTWRWSTKLGAWVMLVAAAIVMLTGDWQGKVMTQVQPMKMAAAEAHYETDSEAGFSLFTIGSLDGSEEIFSVKIPGLLSYLGHGSWDTQVQGINDLEEQYAREGFRHDDGTQTALQAEYASTLKNVPVDVTPNIPVAYWTFRAMMGLGFLGMAAAAWVLWTLRKGRNPMPTKWWRGWMIALPFLPLAAISFGWIFTEMGRQPWLVAGVMPTYTGVSPSVTAGEVLFSTIVYTLLYGALAVIEFGLIIRYVKKGLPEVEPVEVNTDDDAPLSFAY